MPRDQAGRPQETLKMPAASKVAPDSTATSAHCPHCSEHRDRLDTIEKHLGLTHKADGMKSEDQAGSGKTESAGKVTEKARASYGRKRH
jgi:hypothetical protein